jgi:hypothetical protein
LYILAFSQNRQDEVFLDFTPGHDTIAVAKLDNPGITLALGNSPNRYSIAGLAAVETEGIVPLNLRRAGSIFQLKFKRAGTETAHYQIYLKDDGLGEISQLTGDSAIFTYDALGIESDRFSLLIQPVVPASSKKTLSSVFCPYGLRSFSGEYCILDLGGRVLWKGKDVIPGIDELPLPPGLYRMVSAEEHKTYMLRR